MIKYTVFSGATFAVLWFRKSSAMGCWGGREGMAPCGAWEAQSSSCGGAERWGGREVCH